MEGARTRGSMIATIGQSIGSLRGKRTLGIAGKIRLIVAGVVTLTAIALMTVLFFSQRDAIRQAAIIRAQSLTTALARYASDYLYRDRIDEARMMAKSLLHEPDILQVIVIDTTGFVIADGSKDGELMFDTVEDETVDEALATRSPVMAFREDTLVAAAPSLVKMHDVGAVRLTFSLSNMRAELADALYEAALVGLAALCSALLASHLLIAQIRRPLEILMSGTRRVSEGELDHRMTLDTNDELQELAVAFNHMLEKLDGSMRRTESLAFSDQLTGLPNRTSARTLAENVLEDRERCGCHVALMFLDVDRFKFVNDSFGHEVGDELLEQFASIVSSTLRRGATGSVHGSGRGEGSDGYPILARVGGDEFTIVVPRLGSREDAGRIAGRILTALSTPIQLAGRSLRVSTSIGIVIAPDDGIHFDVLLQKADMAMYAAKASGRGCYAFYEDQMQQATTRRLGLENDLREAIDNEQLRIFAQPQTSLSTGRLVGVEMLLRWEHPTRGLVPPDVFIPIAEDNGLIDIMGAWVRREACRWFRRWRKCGIGDLRIGVNVAAGEFEQSDFVERIEAMLTDHDMPPEMLELELTESAMLVNPDQTADKLRALRARGVKVAIDDFGTGYSSLGKLKHLPFDRIKIDRSFIKDTPDDLDDVAITEAIIGLGQSLGYEAIAEGVETDEQVALLRRLGCPEIQGYLVARPMPVEDIEGWLAENQALAPLPNPEPKVATGEPRSASALS